MPIWSPHSAKQERAVRSKKRIVLCGTGIQWGKTATGAIRMKIAMHEHTAKNDTFIVSAPTYKIMNQSTLPAFLAVMGGCGRYNKATAEFKMYGGGTAFMRTASDPNSVVGITNCRHVWADECGVMPLYMWENLQARAAFKEAPLTLTTSPYSLNWVFKELIRPFQRGREGRDDVELIQARSDENPYFPAAEMERRRKTMDSRRFQMVFGGQWGRMEGLVYDCFDEDENTLDAFTLPTGTTYVAGVDWGYSDPFIMCIRGITDTGMHYQVSEYCKTGMTLADMVRVAKQKQEIWGIDRFYCDPSQPGYIEEFKRNGLLAIPANNDVRVGVDVHYELIKGRRYKIFKGSSPNTIDEMEMYHWPEPKDLTVDQDAKELNPVKQNDHCMDANRYVSVMTYKRPTAGRIDAHVPEEKPEGMSRFDRYRELIAINNEDEWS